MINTPVQPTSPLLLITDDDVVTRTLLRMTLEKDGYRILEADNGQHCLTLYQAQKPDMVLLDARMPVMDGFTCCAELKRLPGGRHIPVLMLTGLDDKESVEQAFAVGATDYVTKPVQPSVLTVRLRRILEAAWAKAELHRQNSIFQVELKRASEYVHTLLPPALTEDVTIHGQLIPSLQLGGDVFDYYWLDENHLAVYLLDVAGHGVKSALLSVSVLNILRTRSLPNTDFYKPAAVLAALNQAFQMSDDGEDYFTIWYGVYSRHKRQLTYAAAGHPPAILFSQTSDHAHNVQHLDAGGIPIGMLPNIEFDQKACEIKPGSSFYVFSDGVYEIQQPNGEIWGLDAFVQLLQICEQQNIDNLDYVFNQVLQISGQPTLGDDFSLLKVNWS
ncbi:MAG: SpoIIE family protein phosphatase [Cyanothece sp. SIO1E1]|nr:SpoIIE family protein phosphatase [Cyanothece sp. SIO1E1]